MDGNSQMNLTGNTKFPAWIQAYLFEDVLKSIYKDFNGIIDFSVDNALAPGENYATIMLKVEIMMKLKDSTFKSVNFMLKIGHESELFRDFMKNHNVFAIEAGMYCDYVPEFEKLYADVGVNVQFGAKSYKLPIKENYILLENLQVKGFKNTNRLEGLDKNHTQHVLKKLAQWHAASAVRVACQGSYPRDYCTAYVKPEGYDFLKSMFDGTTNTLLECIREYNNSELYFNKVAKLQNQITDEILRNAELDFNEFNVLNHGDCWSNNIMFKYDEHGNILETYFVDYQMTRYTTPAFDLFYFLLSSTRLDIKLREFDYFIKFYHDHLVENLKILKYSKSIPSLKEIHQMLYKYGLHGYVTCTTVMAAVLCNPTDNASLDNFVSKSEDGVKFRKQMFSNDRFRSHMEAILPWLLYKGFLDC